MYIDTHVHFRDFKQRDKETIAHGLDVAKDSGLDAVFDMPNTDPPLMTRDLVQERLLLAREANVPEVFYGLYMGLTADPGQVKRAVDIYREFPDVVGMKLYAGHSVGKLGIIIVEDQAVIYETLAREGYDGVLAVHAEKEDCLHPEVWDPTHPVSHCHARPEKAEVESVQDQIRLAQQANFSGKLHIAHLSAPGAVELVVAARNDGMDISSGICPHHFIYNWQQMYDEHGVRWKMNPPLRSPESAAKMFGYLRDGSIDWIETDHAPHTRAQKDESPFMSGIPGIAWWPVFHEYLRQNNFSDQRIEDITFNNAAKRFGLDITRSKRLQRDRRADYWFNPYTPMEDRLR